MRCAERNRHGDQHHTPKESPSWTGGPDRLRRLPGRRTAKRLGSRLRRNSRNALHAARIAAGAKTHLKRGSRSNPGIRIGALANV
jgi:hypothetical protein